MYRYQFVIFWLGLKDLKNVTCLFDVENCLHFFCELLTLSSASRRQVSAVSSCLQVFSCEFYENVKCKRNLKFNKRVQYYILGAFHIISYCGAMVQWLSQLHNFIQQCLNSGSAQVQISSIVNWGYPDNFKPAHFFFFFYEEKILRAQKHVTSKNQLTKQK